MMKHMEFSNRFFNLRVLPLLYTKFIQTFQIGPKCTINFQGLASLRNKDCFQKIFFKRFSIKFYIWKSNGLFSIGWVSPLKMDPK